MTRHKLSVAMGGALVSTMALAGCGSSSDSAPDVASSPSNPSVPSTPSTSIAAPATSASKPPQVSDFPALASKDCAVVVQFYLEAIGGHDYARAMLVWNDPLGDADRLKSIYAPYKVPQIKWAQPEVEGAAGSLYCTVNGELTDAADPEKAARDGTLVLRRVNDVPGATPDQLRWTLRSSTFIEKPNQSEQAKP